MSADAITQIQDAWRSLPPDIKQDIQRRAMQIWQMRGGYPTRFITVLNGLFGQNPAAWQQALLRDRAGTAQHLARLAGQMARLPRAGPSPPGMSPVQVREYHRRQRLAAAYLAASRQTVRYRELELEFDLIRQP